MAETGKVDEAIEIINNLDKGIVENFTFQAKDNIVKAFVLAGRHQGCLPLLKGKAYLSTYLKVFAGAIEHDMDDFAKEVIVSMKEGLYVSNKGIAQRASDAMANLPEDKVDKFFNILAADFPEVASVRIMVRA